jgi:hypothetical protein
MYFLIIYHTIFLASNRASKSTRPLFSLPRQSRVKGDEAPGLHIVGAKPSEAP